MLQEYILVIFVTPTSITYGVLFLFSSSFFNEYLTTLHCFMNQRFKRDKPLDSNGFISWKARAQLKLGPAHLMFLKL